MAVVVPLFLSSGINDVQASAHFNSHGELAFDLRVAIPTSKLIEALLRYHNRSSDECPSTGGSLTELPLQSQAESVQASAQASAQSRGRVINRPVPKVPPVEAVPKDAGAPPHAATAGGGQAAFVAASAATVTREGYSEAPHAPLIATGWDSPLRTAAHSMPHFTAFSDVPVRWSKGPNGMGTWTGAEERTPVIADETQIVLVRPQRLHYEPLPPRSLIEPPRQAVSSQPQTFLLARTQPAMREAQQETTTARLCSCGAPLTVGANFCSMCGHNTQVQSESLQQEEAAPQLSEPEPGSEPGGQSTS